MHYKLLTPGPLTTTKTVKESMLKDWCTWDDEYKLVVQNIRYQLLELFQIDASRYTTVLMQGSGSFGVEATIGSVLNNTTDQLLVLSNGEYGRRIAMTAKIIGKKVEEFSSEEILPLDPVALDIYLNNNPMVTHVAFVHCETTTGILNPLDSLTAICKKHNKIVIVDAMSSFGGIYIDLNHLDIDYLISSANKCIQGVPGFSFVIAKKDLLSKCQGHSHSLVLDLYDQWNTMELDQGKWRFTSPTHVVRAFQQALNELKEESPKARYLRYAKSQALLVDRMNKIGFQCCIEAQWHSPIISTFLFYPHPRFSFKGLYEALKSDGFVIYPGKLSNLEVFRIGNIGEIYAQDINELTDLIQRYIDNL